MLLRSHPRSLLWTLSHIQTLPLFYSYIYFQKCLQKPFSPGLADKFFGYLTFLAGGSVATMFLSTPQEQKRCDFEYDRNKLHPMKYFSLVNDVVLR